jgi:hypothetical protein
MIQDERCEDEANKIWAILDSGVVGNNGIKINLPPNLGVYLVFQLV